MNIEYRKSNNIKTKKLVIGFCVGRLLFNVWIKGFKSMNTLSDSWFFCFDTNKNFRVIMSSKIQYDDMWIMISENNKPIYSVGMTTEQNILIRKHVKRFIEIKEVRNYEDIHKI